MSRLQKKCFVGASGMHVLLLVILFVGPAFFVADKVDDAPVLEIIPDRTTDLDMKGGGNPSPQTATQPPPQPPPAQQVVQPQRIEPQPPEKAVEKTEPQKVEKTEPVKPTKTDDALEAKDKKQPHKVQVSDSVVKIPRKTQTANRATSTSEEKAAAERRQLFSSAARSLRQGLSPTTTVEMPQGGFGGGGFSYANYAQVVRKIYTDAWMVPDDVTDDDATVKVKVVIARAGNVLSSSIIQSSGSAAVDRSIQATLDRVTFVAPFPEGAKESQRTFTINFSLKAKKLLG